MSGIKSKAERWEERFMVRRAMADMIAKRPRLASLIALTKHMDAQRELGERLRKRK